MDPRHKDMVAFPEVKLKHMLVRNPFQSTLRGIDQLASEIVCGKDENIPVIGFIVKKIKERFKVEE